MNHTKPLDIIPDYNFHLCKFVINPNTGFELGYMNSCHSVNLCANIPLEKFRKNEDKGLQIQLHLVNECKPGAIEMSKTYWQKLGEPKKAILVSEENRVLLVTNTSK